MDAEEASASSSSTETSSDEESDMSSVSSFTATHGGRASLLKQMTTAFKGSILCDFGSYNNDLSRVLPRVRNFIGESEPPDQGARYPEREAFYVGLLTHLHELS